MFSDRNRLVGQIYYPLNSPSPDLKIHETIVYKALKIRKRKLIPNDEKYDCLSFGRFFCGTQKGNQKNLGDFLR